MYQRLLAGRVKPECDLYKAEQLLSENPLSDRFPGGYKKVAHLFQPWFDVDWKYTEPSKVIGMATMAWFIYLMNDLYGFQALKQLGHVNQKALHCIVDCKYAF